MSDAALIDAMLFIMASTLPRSTSAMIPASMSNVSSAESIDLKRFLFKAFPRHVSVRWRSFSSRLSRSALISAHSFNSLLTSSGAAGFL